MNGNSLGTASDVTKLAPKRCETEMARMFINNFNFYCRQRFGGEQLTVNKLYFYCNFICTSLSRCIVWEWEANRQFHLVWMTSDDGVWMQKWKDRRCFVTSVFSHNRNHWRPLDDERDPKNPIHLTKISILEVAIQRQFLNWSAAEVIFLEANKYWDNRLHLSAGFVSVMWNG